MQPNIVSSTETTTKTKPEERKSQAKSVLGEEYQCRPRLVRPESRKTKPKVKKISGEFNPR